MIKLRKLHLIVGFLLAPFLFIQAVTRFAQVLGMFAPLVVRFHSGMILVRCFGLVVATGLALLATSGGILYVSTSIQQARRKTKAASAQEAAACRGFDRESRARRLIAVSGRTRCAKTAK